MKKGYQSGGALLAFMLVILAGTSFALVSKLNSATNQFSRGYSSMTALQEAKAALIGYAVTYPDTHPGEGPGFLPCPDRDNDGTTDGGSCALSPNATTIGRLPYETLEISRVADHFGEVLWYAVADNYKNNIKVPQLNSDTPGNFTVGATNDIVAIIFAPGPPIAAQSRSTTAEQLDVVNYLEDDNADNDAIFVTQSADVQDSDYREKFNDRLITITRQELMKVVEKRVLGDVATALVNYQASNNAYPWLSLFADPSSSTFRGQSGRREGHIPYHYSGDTAGASNRNPFSTNITASWDNVTNANTSRSGTVSTTCLNNINCNDGIFPVVSELIPDSLPLDCNWSDKDTADCVSFKVTRTSPHVYSAACPAGGTLTRTYTLDFPAFTGTSTIDAQTTIDVRRRDVSLTGNLPSQAGVIQITDVYAGQRRLCFGGFFCWCWWDSYQQTGTGTVEFDGDTTGTITINNMQYDIDVDNNELPAWFVKNGWQDLIYLAYAHGEPLPGSTTAGEDCNSLTPLVDDCLTVNVNGMTNTNVRAVAINSGTDLTASRPSTVLSDYLEGDNNNSDATFVKNRTTTTYNDQTRIIATAP